MRVDRVRLLGALAIVITAALPAAARAQSDAKPDITGKWTFNVVYDGGSGTPTVTFKQQGDSLTGRYASTTLGEHDFKGTLKDGKLTFAFDADVQGQQFMMKFAGTVDGADTMKGTVDLGGMATGTFTGKRQKP